VIECHRSCYGENPSLDGRVRAGAVRRIFQHIKPDGSLVSCLRHDVADDAARLQFQRGKPRSGGKQLRATFLEIGDPPTALSSQCAQHLAAVRAWAELRLHSGASRLGRRVGVDPPGVGPRFGPPHDRYQAQHKAEYEQNQDRPRCESGRQRFGDRLKSRKGVHRAIPLANGKETRHKPGAAQSWLAQIYRISFRQVDMEPA